MESGSPSWLCSSPLPQPWYTPARRPNCCPSIFCGTNNGLVCKTQLKLVTELHQKQRYPALGVNMGRTVLRKPDGRVKAIENKGCCLFPNRDNNRLNSPGTLRGTNRK